MVKNFISASWELNSHIRERTKYNFIVIKCHGAQHFLSTWIPTLTLYIKFWSYVFGTNMTTVVYCMHLKAKLQSNKWPIFKLFRQGRALIPKCLSAGVIKEAIYSFVLMIGNYWLNANETIEAEKPSLTVSAYTSRYLVSRSPES